MGNQIKKYLFLAPVQVKGRCILRFLKVMKFCGMSHRKKKSFVAVADPKKIAAAHEQKFCGPRTHTCDISQRGLSEKFGSLWTPGPETTLPGTQNNPLSFHLKEA